MKNRNKYKIKLLFVLLFCWITISIIKSPFFELIENSESIKTKTEKFNESKDGLVSPRIDLNKTKHFVIVSIDLNSNKDYYIFLLPYLVLAWRRVNYEPIFLFIVEKRKQHLTNKKLEQLSKTTEILRFLNATILKVPSNEKYPFMIPMIIRLFIGILPQDLVNDEDFVITSDADLIPISKNYYVPSNQTPITIWNAFCCKKFDFKSKYSQT